MALNNYYFKDYATISTCKKGTYPVSSIFLIKHLSSESGVLCPIIAAFKMLPIH